MNVFWVMQNSIHHENDTLLLIMSDVSANAYKRCPVSIHYAKNNRLVVYKISHPLVHVVTENDMIA